MTTRTTHARRLATAALVAGLALLTFGFVAPGASAADSNPTFVDGANPTCPDQAVGGFPSDFKIDQQPPDGDSTWTTADAELAGDVPPTLVIVISNLVQGGGTVTFDWSATVADGDDAGTERDPFLIDRVLVKASTGANMWTYDPPASSGTGLYSPKDSISHINFCFGPHVSELTTTTTEGDTTTTEGDTTTTEGDTTTTGDTTATTGDSVSPSTDSVAPSETVGGVTVAKTAALPATGANSWSLMILGAALTLAGAASLALSNRAATAATPRYQPKHRR